MEKYDGYKASERKLLYQQEKLTSDPENIDYEKLAKVRSELAIVQENAAKIQDEALGGKVEEEDLTKVIELWTGIPASRIQENELSKLANIEDKLKEKIIGQDEAVEAVSAAIRRSRVQISPRRRPASFILLDLPG